MFHRYNNFDFLILLAAAFILYFLFLAAKRYGEIRATSEISVFKSLTDTFTSELKGLVNEVIELIGMIPSGNRKLITTHESLGYLEAKFGLEVLATIIPSLDSSDEVSPSDLVEVIEVIEEEGVKVMFVESETPSVYAETLAEETGITLVTGLYVETLKPNQSYSEFLISNVELIVNNLK